MVPGIVDEPLIVRVVAVGKFHMIKATSPPPTELKFGGDQVKVFPDPAVSTLMMSGVDALGEFRKFRIAMLARFAAVILSMCTPALRVTKALVPGGMVAGSGVPFAAVSTTVPGQAARLVEFERNVLNALEKPTSPDWFTEAVGWLAPAAICGSEE